MNFSALHENCSVLVLFLNFGCNKTRIKYLTRFSLPTDADPPGVQFRKYQKA